MNTLFYAWLLNFYPEDLRREYGEEMTLVFAEELRSRGWLRVWWNALRDLLRFALPHTLSLPGLRIPVSGGVFFMLCFLTEFVMDRVIQRPGRFVVAAALPSLAMVLLPFVVIWACRGRAVISLGIAEYEKQ